MSDDNAQAWLRIAAGEVRDIPRDILVDACAAARKTCTHHGQIVPAILTEAEPRAAQRRRLAAPVERPALALPPADPWAPTAAELAELKRAAAERLKA